MNLDQAAVSLDAMGNTTRLHIVRLLVRAGEDGLAVGNIQKKLDIPPSTLTHHLIQLRSAGLIRQERQGTTLMCKMQFRQLDSVWQFVMKQCCMDMVSEQLRSG